MGGNGDGVLFDVFPVDDHDPSFERLFRGGLVGLQIGPTTFRAW